jgi:hypothetical protein
MSNQVFDFCDTSRVIEEIPPEDQTASSMNGWDFTAKPKIPYRRTFKVALHGMRWYLATGGASLDITTDTNFIVIIGCGIVSYSTMSISVKFEFGLTSLYGFRQRSQIVMDIVRQLR